LAAGAFRALPAGAAASATGSSRSCVTDSNLLALARANKGKLATLDQNLATEVVSEGKSSLALI
jgi:predicted nucleic acid-binding protein